MLCDYCNNYVDILDVETCFKCFKCLCYSCETINNECHFCISKRHIDLSFDDIDIFTL